VPKKRRALASVANPYDRKKKSKPLSGKENLGLVSKNTNDVKSSIAEMEMKPRAVSLSPEDTRFELHYPRAHGPIKSHGDLFFKITGVKAYSTTCPPEKMLEGLVEDRYTKVFCGHYAPPHMDGNPYGYVVKDGRALDHTTHLAERAFVRSLPKEFETLATLNHMFHVFFDLYDGSHELTNDTGGRFSWWKDCMKVISVANRNALLKSKIYMIQMIIVDEIVVRKRISMRVFAFGKLACEYFPIYLEMARKLAVEETSAILGKTVKYDILFPSEKTGELPSVGGKIKCGNTELQHVCMADSFMSLDHRVRLDGAIAFVCKDLLAGKCVTYFQSLSSRYGNYSESELQELNKDLWANRSDEYKLKQSEDGKRRHIELRKISSGSTEEETYYDRWSK